MDQRHEGSLRVLKVDIDPGGRIYSMRHMDGLMARAGYKIKSLSRQRSQSGKGWHLWITLDREVSHPMELVALQAIMGSDRYREACNAQRVRTIATMPRKLRDFWESRWNVFYEGR